MLDKFIRICSRTEVIVPWNLNYLHSAQCCNKWCANNRVNKMAQLVRVLSLIPKFLCSSTKIQLVGENSQVLQAGLWSNTFTAICMKTHTYISTHGHTHTHIHSHKFSFNLFIFIISLTSLYLGWFYKTLWIMRLLRKLNEMKLGIFPMH